MAKTETIKELNDVREILFGLYPDATKITVVIDGEKIKVTPNEEYNVPLDLEIEDEE